MYEKNIQKNHFHGICYCSDLGSVNDVITLKRLTDGYIDELPVGTSFLY